MVGLDDECNDCLTCQMFLFVHSGIVLCVCCARLLLDEIFYGALRIQ